MRAVPLFLALGLCAACSGGHDNDAAANSAAVTADASAVAAPATLPAPTGPITIRIKDNKFVPAELEVPANTKFELLVVNEDPTPEEFESHELNREKIVTGNGQITVPIGPLKPGRYPFFGEFHMATAQGALIAK
jgi:hypothetical protein